MPRLSDIYYDHAYDISVLMHVVCPVPLTILEVSGSIFPIGNDLFQ